MMPFHVLGVSVLAGIFYLTIETVYRNNGGRDALKAATLLFVLVLLILAVIG